MTIHETNTEATFVLKLQQSEFVKGSTAVNLKMLHLTYVMKKIIFHKLLYYQNQRFTIYLISCIVSIDCEAIEYLTVYNYVVQITLFLFMQNKTYRR